MSAAGYAEYYLDHLYTTVIVGTFKGPIARASDWVNAKIIDGVVNFAGERSAQAGRALYTHVDQKLVDGAVNLSGAASSDAGEGLRRIQTGKIRQYATLFFAAATVMAGVLVVIV